MKFPSINYVTAQAITSLKRFPLSLLFAVVGTFAVIMITETNDFWQPLLQTCVLGVPASLGCVLFAERSNNAVIKRMSSLIVIALAALYFYFWAPHSFFSDSRLSMIFFVLAVSLHLWVSIAPYLGRDEKIGFWRFNEQLFARMFLSMLFSGVLYAGLALALFACKTLLKIDVNDKTFFHLWAIIAGIFNTWFFLSGVPKDYQEIDQDHLFPKGLKIFTQYILIPLTLLYLVILYVYCIKIIGMWRLPKGWVSTLILSYSIIGILSTLLVYPLRNDSGNPWVRLFARFFFIATLPLIILLYIAIYARVHPYGFTEERYYLLVLGTWLGCISLYFIFSLKKNIKIIPCSLAIVGVLTLAGPWSAFSVSNRSQLHQLETILMKNDIWRPGMKVTKAVKSLPHTDALEVKDIINYFIDRGSVSMLQPIFTTDLNTLSKNIHHKYQLEGYDWQERYKMNDTLLALLYTNADRTSEVNYVADKDYGINDGVGIDISGYSKAYDYLYRCNESRKSWVYISDGDSLSISIEATQMIFMRHDNQVATASLNGIINTLTADTIHNHMHEPLSTMTVNTTGTLDARIIIKFIELPNNETDTSKKIEELRAWILLK